MSLASCRCSIPVFSLDKMGGERFTDRDPAEGKKPGGSSERRTHRLAADVHRACGQRETCVSHGHTESPGLVGIDSRDATKVRTWPRPESNSLLLTAGVAPCCRRTEDVEHQRRYSLTIDGRGNFAPKTPRVRIETNQYRPAVELIIRQIGRYGHQQP